MLQGLLVIVGSFGICAALVHIYHGRYAPYNKVQHYVFTITNNQMQVEGYLRALLAGSRIKGTPLRITIIDEGSKDDTLAIISRLTCAHDVELFYMRQPQHEPLVTMTPSTPQHEPNLSNQFNISNLSNESTLSLSNQPNLPSLSNESTLSLLNQSNQPNLSNEPPLSLLNQSNPVGPSILTHESNPSNSVTQSIPLYVSNLIDPAFDEVLISIHLNHPEDIRKFMH